MNKVENRAERFFQQMQGKRVAFCGIGGSNLPLIKIFAQRGAVVSARDRRGYQQVQQAAELEKWAFGWFWAIIFAGPDGGGCLPHTGHAIICRAGCRP
ncbi:MAG: hypothetical protein ACLSB9_28920 [Hydrogeniiclostridium mannosilyticum]